MPVRKLWAIDAETDRFLVADEPDEGPNDWKRIENKETGRVQYGRVPLPFIWGAYCENDYRTFNSTAELVSFFQNKNVLLYAHNGGKFDFMFLLPFIGNTKAQIINGRIVSMFLGKAELRDSFAIIPEALKKFGDKGDIEYWKMDREVRDQYMQEIKDYLYKDCKILYDAVSAYRRVAGTGKTIAGNALAFAKKLGIDPGKTSHSYDRHFRTFFYGGRTECFRPGTHRNVKLFDIHSAYPFAMLHEHATGTAFRSRDNLLGLSDQQIQRSFIRLTCNSRGAFPKRKTVNHIPGLFFPHEHAEFHVTGWEYLVAMKHNLIDDIEIISVDTFEHTINFREYVEHWYAYKEAHPKDIDPIHYIIGKIMMNSLYGKLAQDPANYFDYRIVAAGTPICEFEPDRKNEKKCALCGGKLYDHGWQLGPEYPDHEIHMRPSLWRYKFEFGVQWTGQPVYKNVATGASITGFTRAHILDAIHTIGPQHIIYTDTDSLMCDESTDVSRLKISPAIGDWAFEGEGTIGHFAGKKLYGISLAEIDKKTGKPKQKIASKGSKLDYQNLEKIINGESVSWVNEAPTFKIDGSASFVVRNIRATAH